MTLHRVFAYGTLKNPEKRKSIILRETNIEEDFLTGFRVEMVKLNGIFYPAAIHEPLSRDKIRGATFMVSEAELEKLDVYESDAYKRIRVKLLSGKQSWLYIKA
ncbi:MAG: gamma-glutamylcyclotransferase [Bacteroidales bacterium]|nr:gamma-glutamylcyclotransferase [Bacteroidales bacterium]